MRPRPRGHAGRSSVRQHAAALLLVMLVSAVCCWDELPQTSSGSLRGDAVLASNGRRVLRLLGVRYADKPRRFSLPVQHRVDDTNRVVDAVDWPPACPQASNLSEIDGYPQLRRRSGGAQSEDCLFLNVFAPAPADGSGGRAVLLWLPGETFGVADASRYDATELAAQADVVVIVPNYRVGALGFLAVGAAFGANWAALDVLEAVRWTRENAMALGADAGRLAVAGRASGAALASLLLLSGPQPPLTRAVLVGGVASSWYSLEQDPTAVAAKLASRLSCRGSATQVLDCLKSAPLASLLEASVGLPWRPVLDGSVFIAEPLKAVRRIQKADNVSVMVGEASGEGALCLTRHYQLETDWWPYIAADNITRRQFIDLVAEHMMDFAAIQDGSVLNTTVHEYRPWGQVGSSFRSALLRFCGLMYSRGRAEQLSRALTKRGASVWRFEFDHRPAQSPHPDFAGVAPGDELAYLFAESDQVERQSAEESSLAQEVVTAWGNFIKTGNPNVGEGDAASSINWPLFVDSSREMYVFTSKSTKTKSSEFLSKDADFWGSVVPSLLRNSQRGSSGGSRRKNSRGQSACGRSSCPAFGVLIAVSVILATSLSALGYFYVRTVRRSKGLLANEQLPQS